MQEEEASSRRMLGATGRSGVQRRTRKCPERSWLRRGVCDVRRLRSGSACERRIETSARPLELLDKLFRVVAVDRTTELGERLLCGGELLARFFQFNLRLLDE